MRKRSFLPFLLLSVCIFVLFACGDSSNTETETIETTEISTPAVTVSSVTTLEDRLSTLFQNETQAGLTLDEVTFFGTPMAGLLLEDAISITEENGFTGTLYVKGNGFSYQASFPDSTSPLIYFHQVDTDDHLTLITYKHAIPDGAFWGRNATDSPVWVGIGDIYTFDGLEETLHKLNYSNSAELANILREILSLPSSDALALLWQLDSYGFCCETSGESVSAKNDRLTEWRFMWTTTDPQTRRTYQIEFNYYVEEDCLTGVAIWIQ